MKLLITGAWHCDAADETALRDMGYELLFQPDERGALPCDPAVIEAVVCNGLFLYQDVSRFTALRFIQVTSAGLDRLPMDILRERGIAVYNARGVYSVPMAEFALCAVLQFLKQSRYFAEKQAQGAWEKHRGLLELAGKTVCIVGCGSVGSACAQRFRAFDCTLLGVDVFDAPGFDEMVSLQDGLRRADVVVLTLPLTAETAHCINQETLALLRPGAILVNIARGGIIDTPALTERLRRGDLYTALDVFEEEPLAADSPLWQMENVILTPHNSFVGDGNAARLRHVIIHNLEQQMQ